MLNVASSARHGVQGHRALQDNKDTIIDIDALPSLSNEKLLLNFETASAVKDTVRLIGQVIPSVLSILCPFLPIRDMNSLCRATLSLYKHMWMSMQIQMLLKGIRRDVAAETPLSDEAQCRGVVHRGVQLQTFLLHVPVSRLIHGESLCLYLRHVGQLHQIHNTCSPTSLCLANLSTLLRGFMKLLVLCAYDAGDSMRHFLSPPDCERNAPIAFPYRGFLRPKPSRCAISPQFALEMVPSTRAVCFKRCLVPILSRLLMHRQHRW